jgi:hypothetical protein
VGKVYNLCRVKTDRSAVLTVKSGLDPQSNLKMDINRGSCGSLGLGFLLKLKWVGINLDLVTRCC